MLERVAGGVAHRGRHDAAAPVGLAEPVSEVRVAAPDAFVDVGADAAHREAVDFDGPARAARLAGEMREPGVGICVRVGVRKAMREVALDVAIVGEVHE